MKLNIPNSLTASRILMVPILVLLFYWPFEHYRFAVLGAVFEYNLVAASLVYTLAAITDWFDGYLARKLGQTTKFGAFLDPVADKLMVAMALVLLVERHASPLFTLAACVIVGREIVVSGLREWMAELGRRTSVAVSFLGKVKTGVQMFAIIVLLALHPEYSHPWLLYLAYLALFLAATLTLYSMTIYLKAAWTTLRENPK